MFHVAPVVSVYVVPFEEGQVSEDARLGVNDEDDDAEAEGAGEEVDTVTDRVVLLCAVTVWRVVEERTAVLEESAAVPVAAQFGRVRLSVVLIVPRVTGMVEM